MRITINTDFKQNMIDIENGETTLLYSTKCSEQISENFHSRMKVELLPETVMTYI